MDAAPLSPHAEPALLALLERDPLVDLFLLDQLRTRGLEVAPLGPWYGAWDAAGALAAAALVVGRARPGQPAKLVVPTGDAAGCGDIGRLLRGLGPTEMVIGPREASDGLWSGLGSPPARLAYDQRLYGCRAPSAGPTLDLRPPRREELPQVIVMSAQMMQEDLGIDPRRQALEQYAASVRSRAETGRTWVADVDGQIGFLLNVGTACPEGAQVGGTFVPPRLRGKGVAAAGMRAAVQLLLPQVASVTLHVNEANAAAVRCYERAGFTPVAPFRLLMAGG